MNPHRPYSESIRCGSIEISHDTLMSFALIYFPELFDSHKFDAATIFKCILQIFQFRIELWMTPLELYSIWLTDYLCECSLSWIQLIMLVEFMLFIFWRRWHQYHLFVLSNFWFQFLSIVVIILCSFILWCLFWNLISFDSFRIDDITSTRYGPISVMHGIYTIVATDWSFLLSKGIIWFWSF